MSTVEGKVVAMFVASAARDPMRPVEVVRAVTGKGLDGDRYFALKGTFSSDSPRPDGELTLIELEALEAAARDYGVALKLGEARRNVVTQGVALNHLVGQRFWLGPVEALGMRLCEPCEHLEKLTQKGVLKAFIHRGGLRAQIITGGEVRIGDPIRAAPELHGFSARLP
jgi:MOSC domain-containing protein YiiM